MSSGGLISKNSDESVYTYIFTYLLYFYFFYSVIVTLVTLATVQHNKFSFGITQEMIV